MQVELFKYYIRKFNAGTLVWEYYYVDTAGVVQITTTKTELPQAPKGWEGQTLKWERGFTYYGVFTNYSNPLQFVKDGAIIVKYLYYTFGIEAVAELLIDKHTETVATWGYAEYYRGDLDFSQFKDMKDYCQLSIMDNGFMAKLKAKEATVEEIPVEQNGAVQWVMMDGIDMQAVAGFVGIDQPRFDNGNIDTVAEASTGAGIIRGLFPTALFYGDITGYSNGDINIVGNNYLGNNRAPGVTNNAKTYDFTIIPYTVCKNMSNTLSYDLRVYGSIGTRSVNNSGAADNITPTVTLWAGLGAVQTQAVTIATAAALAPSAGVYQDSVMDFDYTITLAPNELLFFMVEHSHSDPLNMLSTMGINYLDLQISWLNRVPTTYIPCIPATTVGDALVANIDPDATYNGVTGTDYPDYYLTSGDALRNLSNSVLKTSWADFYKAQDCMFNTAFKFDRSTNTATIDYKYTAFDPTTATMDLGEINKFEVGPLTAEMFARLKIGYKPYSYDEINGKEEFNTEVQFQTPLTRVVGEKDLISPYRADMYGIELTRANLTNKVEADKDMDNDVFWLHLDPSIVGTVPSGPGAGQQYYGLRRDPGLTITNMISPSTVFNVDFSPKRRLFAHGYWVRSFMYPNTSGSIEFNTSFKTQNGALGMVTDDGVTIITEKASETIGSLPGTGETPNRNTIFYPLVFTVETKIPLNIMDLMTDPYCELTFTYLGNTYYGWMLEVSDEPSHTPKQVYKLIASPSNTLTTLINGL